MSDAIVGPGRNHVGFFCHRCIVEFEDDVQNETCPFCTTGFVERIENNETVPSVQESENSDAAMSNLDEAGGQDDSAQDQTLEIEISSNPNVGDPSLPMLNDIEFLNRRRTRPGIVRPPRTQFHVEELVWIHGAGPGGIDVALDGPPLMFVGALGDYVFGGEGLDTVVTQLLGQGDNAGAPPLPREQISTIASVPITAAQIEINASCCICWDDFTLGESVSRLECNHFFHQACINTWLELHATCPICRHSLLRPASAATQPAVAQPAAPALALTAAPVMPPTLASQMPVTPESQPAESGSNTLPYITTTSYRRDPFGRQRRGPRWTNNGPGLSGLWAQVSSSINALSNASSSDSNSSDTSSFIDIEFD